MQLTQQQPEFPSPEGSDWESQSSRSRSHYLGRSHLSSSLQFPHNNNSSNSWSTPWTILWVIFVKQEQNYFLCWLVSWPLVGRSSQQQTIGNACQWRNPPCPPSSIQQYHHSDHPNTTFLCHLFSTRFILYYCTIVHFYVTCFLLDLFYTGFYIIVQGWVNLRWRRLS